MPDPTGESTGASTGASGPRRGRELSRAATRRPRPADTGRRHHIGSAPPVLAVLKPDGTVEQTRTAPVQLVDQTTAQLERLAERLQREMATAAAGLEFEAAARLRDEVRAVRRKLAGRDEPAL